MDIDIDLTETENNTHIIKPRVVRFNDREYWCDEIQSVTKAIWEHYVYDSNYVDWCCSIQTHYWLEFYHVSIDFIEGISDEDREDWTEEIWRNVNMSDNSGYYTTNFINECKTIDVENFKIFGEETTFERIKEELQSNPIYFI